MTDYDDAVEPAEDSPTTKKSWITKLIRSIVINAVVAVYLVFAIIKYVNNREPAITASTYWKLIE